MDFPLFLTYFLTTVALETPILLLGLSPRHSLKRRLFAGVWLNACSYPVVFFVLPEIFDVTNDRPMYLLVAEVFAPVSECLLFYLAFGMPVSAPADRVGRETGPGGPLPPPEAARAPASEAVRAPSALAAGPAVEGKTLAEPLPERVGPALTLDAPTRPYTRGEMVRDFAVITLANLVSFLVPECARLAGHPLFGG